jgi:hypothetical protein
MTLNTQIQFYEAMAVPIVASGSKAWTITKNQEGEIESKKVKLSLCLTIKHYAMKAYERVYIYRATFS